MIQGPFRLLHVGCGNSTQADLLPPFNQPPWQEIRVDIDPAWRPDIVASITDMTAVPAQSMHAIWSAHNLEHLYPHEVPRALAEFIRVLSPAGVAVITVPNLAAVAEAILRDGPTATLQHTPAGPVAALDMLYGLRPALAHGQLTMAHRTGFTAESLGDELRRAGFVSIAVEPSPNRWYLWAVASLSGEDSASARQLALQLSAI